MSSSPNVYMVCYDIHDEKRLPRVYRVMRGYGEHLQYSVFRCVLSDLQLATLKARLLEEIKVEEDQVLFVLLGSVNSDRSWRAFSLGTAITEPERVARVF